MSIQGKVYAQESSSDMIKRFYANFKKDGAARKTKTYLEAKAEKLKYFFNNFHSSNQGLLENSTPDERNNLKYFTDNVFEITIDVLDNMDLEIRELLDKFKPAPIVPQINISEDANFTFTQAGSEHSRDVRLAPIEITKFNGSYDKWTTFRALYTSLIHESDRYSSIQKFHYLKSFLVGEASRLINQLSINEDNYIIAWEILEKRYENTRALVNTQLQAIMSQNSIISGSSTSIRTLLDRSAEAILSLKTLKIDTSTWDPILIFVLVNKIDAETHALWENSLQNPKELPKLGQFFDFLETRFHTLENIQNSKPTPKPEVSQNNRNHTNDSTSNGNNRNQSNVSTSNVRQSNWGQRHNNKFRNNAKNFHVNTSIVQSCPVCCNDHEIYHCPLFRDSTIAQRINLVRQYKLCFKCLKAHTFNQCPQVYGCTMCGKAHNNLLHVDQNQQTGNPFQSKTNNGEQAPIVNAHVANKSKNNNQILLATALVKLRSSAGKYINARCLLDQGSQASFMTEQMLNLLNLVPKKVEAQISGLGVLSSSSNQLVEVEMQARNNADYKINVQAVILPTLTTILPSMRMTTGEWNHLNGCFLADPQFSEPGKIDMLLGADIYSYVLKAGIRKGCAGSPMAQDTELGWILSGNVSNSPDKSNAINSFMCQIDIDKSLTKFWEIEESIKERALTQEEEQCEQHFRSTHTRNVTGRYSVSLPFKSDSPMLGTSRGQAISRLMSIEKRLANDINLRKSYNTFMQEYLDLHHMEPVTQQHNNATSYYLPHHPVIKESSSTTKLRVVFDASAKTSSGFCLNDKLLVGATYQKDLVSIIMKWRFHRIVFAADIPKMYRQILVESNDAEFQRIVFRFSPDHPIQDYKLRTVTYGTSSAPFLAIRTLQQVAIDYQTQFPLASKVTLDDFYVDDVMSGADTLKEALVMQTDLISMLKKGGFELKKWISNREEILKAVPKEDREVSLPLKIEIDPTMKTLGINYHPAEDHFRFLVSLEEKCKKLTKRNLLSETSKIFDPLGWLAPVIIKAKIFFQELWMLKLTWDEELPKDVAERWEKFRGTFYSLQEITIPRWIGTSKLSSHLELHGFSDASEKAYAAVIYARITDKNETKSVLICSKTRVAPIKTLSIPRLELCGAVLLSSILKRTAEAMNVNQDDTYLWCDSTIVLGWLKAHPTKYKTFVANRLAEISNNSDITKWKHVKSSENPADCASRGLDPTELPIHHLWWNGPRWLSQPKTTWPKSIQNTEETKLEMKSITTLLAVIQNDANNLLVKFSNSNKLFRITSLCFRFYKCLKEAVSSKIKPQVRTKMDSNKLISVQDLLEARFFWIRYVQQMEYSEEIKCLKEGKLVSKRSKLCQLNVFIDASGIVRVGGRITNSTGPFETKHPIVLPYGNVLTKLIIRHAHYITLHGGVQLTMNFLRINYWIIGMRNAVKGVVRKCVICSRFASKLQSQLMGDLPKPRVHLTRPFTNVGVDYAGPIDIRTSKGRGHKCTKGYIAVFVCLATKAIHLEAVTSLTSQSFLDAFERFSARRGLCSNIYSDNGTNFVGASKKILDRFETQIHQENSELYIVLANKGTQWHFIPPAAPHFGGLWEAGVKSMKIHMRKILGTTTFTFEEMSTALCKVEACLNSRPLCPLTEDPEDLSVLTPGHFLIGGPLIAPPQSDLSDININKLQRWRHIEKVTQDFWKRWNTEYLSRLQQRPKWATREVNIAINDMVLLKDENLPPSRWCLCRVKEVHPGKDELVRVVTLKTKNGLIKRPISKLCKLPIGSEAPSKNS